MEALEKEKVQLEEHMSKTRGLMTAMQVGGRGRGGK
jgi:hypothetical protein